MVVVGTFLKKVPTTTIHSFIHSFIHTGSLCGHGRPGLSNISLCLQNLARSWFHEFPLDKARVRFPVYFKRMGYAEFVDKKMRRFYSRPIQFDLTMKQRWDSRGNWDHSYSHLHGSHSHSHSHSHITLKIFCPILDHGNPMGFPFPCTPLLWSRPTRSAFRPTRMNGPRRVATCDKTTTTSLPLGRSTSYKRFLVDSRWS